MSRKLFRHNPLDKLAELDHLNKQLVVVNVKVKMVMLLVFIIILFLLFWSLFGKISSWIEGPSILFHPGKVYSIFAEDDGWVKGVSVKRGQIVEENLQLMEVSYPDLSDRFDQDKQSLSLLQSEYSELEKEVQKRQTAQKRTTQIQIDLQKHLLANEAESNILASEREAKIALLEQSIIEVDGEARLSCIRWKIAHFQKTLEEMDRILAKTRITALEKSLVQDLVAYGSAISKGQPLIRMQEIVPGYQEGRIYCFVPIAYENKISSGMKTVTTVDCRGESLGRVSGKVVSVESIDKVVSQMVDFQEMASSRLPSSLNETNKYVVVIIDLDKDQDSKGGYKWIQNPSDEGSIPISICFLTPNTTKILIELQSPLKYAFSLFRGAQ